MSKEENNDDDDDDDGNMEGAKLGDWNVMHLFEGGEMVPQQVGEERSEAKDSNE